MEIFPLPLLPCHLSSNQISELSKEELSALHKLNTVDLIDNIPDVRSFNNINNGRHLIRCYGLFTRSATVVFADSHDDMFIVSESDLPHVFRCAACQKEFNEIWGDISKIDNECSELIRLMFSEDLKEYFTMLHTSQQQEIILKVNKHLHLSPNKRRCRND